MSDYFFNEQYYIFDQKALQREEFVRTKNNTRSRNHKFEPDYEIEVAREQAALDQIANELGYIPVFAKPEKVTKPVVLTPRQELFQMTTVHSNAADII